MGWPQIFSKKKFWYGVAGAAVVVVVVTLLAVFLSPQPEEVDPQTTVTPPPTTVPPIPPPPTTTTSTTEQPEQQEELEFSDDFMFGSASSSYQIEGAWNIDGKGESIWDKLTHTRPELIRDYQNGDVAANSYYQYKEDVQALKTSGADFYRFSISWPRVLPDGDISSKNEAGLQYYDNLINELLANDIEPMVTMYHWDLPQRLQELGGWTNSYIVQYFEQYSMLLFDRYADRVKHWITFNEPSLFCINGYSAFRAAPMVNASGIGEYLCAHNVLLSNARAYHLYREKYYDQYMGKVGMSLHTNMTLPKDATKPEDVAAAERSLQFWLGWFAHPVFTATGDYPAIMKSVLNENSQMENRKKSRLPVFTAAEVDYIRGTADFFGLNYYASDFAESASESNIDWTSDPSFYRDQYVLKSTNSAGPDGLRSLLNWIKDEYNNPDVIITENGMADTGDLDDIGRITFVNNHLAAILNAKETDGCRVIGYTYWSLLDNFEWMDGYTRRFGLFHVDFNGDVARTAKRSAYVYRQVKDTRKIPIDLPVLPPQDQVFPPNFLFGCSSSSYQIEGAWDRDGKGEHIWDRLLHTRTTFTSDGSNGDVSANSYDLYKEDVKALKLTGVNFYRFSISWARIMPTGDISSLNELGLQYYDNLINELLLNDIKPMITMYHNDLPQRLQDLGGWTNSYISDYFEQYASVLFARYADRVKLWTTFNEVAQFCLLGYGTEQHAPMTNSSGIGEYLCGHNALMAHAKTYRLYREQYYYRFFGKVGIAINSIMALPKDSSNPADVAAAERHMQFWFGWIAHPIFSQDGGYPAIMVDIIGANSETENRKKSRLPVFTEEDIRFVRGTADFIGLNYFTSNYVEPNSDSDLTRDPSFYRDRNVHTSLDSSWPLAESMWLGSNPDGLRATLNWIKENYLNPEVIVTENGWSDKGQINDIERITYLRDHVQAVLDATVVDRCRVTGYAIWSIIDNFEWEDGYTARFGLFHIDFESDQKTRTPKRSAYAYKEIIEQRKVPGSFPEIPPVDEVFPNDFIFGCSSASYQVEGAWNIDGKGESIWDHLTHNTPEAVADRSNGDVAADSYRLYKDDVKALTQIGVNFYRFSISWSRILPDGDFSSLNEASLIYYDNLINELLKNGIEPMVTMYHWDLPQRLQELGGWTNRYIIDYFEQYAKVLYDRYADRVKYWNTFNEAALFCTSGYKADHAPRLWSPGVGEYLCAHHVLLSHARAYHLYHNFYHAQYNGKIGIALNSGHAWPRDRSKPDDVDAAERSNQFQLGLYANPIFSVAGGYPAVVIEYVDRLSLQENRKKSRLPKFTEDEIALIKGSADFMGLNYYTSHYAEPGVQDWWMPNPSIVRDQNVSEMKDENWPIAKSTWLRSIPEGLRALLNWIKDHYDNPEVIITENGWSDEGELNDIGRIEYLNSHLQAVLDARLKDNCHVTGYTHWSVIDNFEWNLGYTERFGMFHVDFESDHRTRTAKRSVSAYRNIIDSRRISQVLPPPPPEEEFPNDFMFGCSSAAYQVEGAWRTDGKGENIWDRLTHSQPEVIYDRSNGDVAADSYTLYKEDVQALKRIGANFYRFSVSWARILPTGDVSSLNELGLQYYDRLIDELLANGIQPMVTMYHWDLPQRLQELGGWANRYIIDYFEQYARVLYDRYADRVKFWNTFNEAALFCTSGFSAGHAPRLWSPGIGEYLCHHHVILSHARAYHLYDDNYRARFGGKIGIALNSGHAWPKDANKQTDIEAAERSNEFQLGLYANPILSKTGGYPAVVREYVDRNSAAENRKMSRLPQFSATEIEYVKGTADFVGLNYYTSHYAEAGSHDWMPNPSFVRDQHVTETKDARWPIAKSTWLQSIPQGLRALLNWIKDKYDNPEVIITENGWSDNGELDDLGRIDYLKTHLQAVLDAKIRDNCNVTGYTHWSVIDNFEWTLGYTERFGLFHVDFESAAKTRTAKRSVYAYNDIIQTRKISKSLPMPLPPPPPPAAQRFPDDFIFGCSSASYQVEGAWNRDGKGENIWDRLTHSQPEVIYDRSNGDVAANSYDFYREDVNALKKIGVNFYRFSISWARILPDGDISSLNEAGLQYYDNLINELLANGIQPMATMYHWDLPQRLQELGGWANRYIIDYFEQYAKVLYDRFADRVKFWNTFNEAALFCTSGFSAGHAPRLWSPGVGEYLCSHHVLLSHARAYHLYHNQYYAQFKGKIGIALNSGHAWPRDPNSRLDVEAAERSNQFQLGMYAHPIYSRTGGYPVVVTTNVDENSRKENRKKSRLPEFTAEEITSLRGSADFFGLNYYTSAFASPGSHDWMPRPSFVRDQDITESHDSSWLVAKSTWLRSIPNGLRALLNWIKNEYDNPEVIITENGWSDDGQLNDVGRINYLKSHLQAVLEARIVDDCNVTGYTHWSVIDNFEWGRGYSERFGMFHVDFSSDDKTRSEKRSVAAYRDVIETRQISTSLPPLQPEMDQVFPDYFLFGSASASYQVEGAWNRDGKGESIWDRLTHDHPEAIYDRSNGDDAANSYDLFREDVKALKLSGVNFYRFSISWTRIMPDGDISSLNELGLQYYDNLINELLANGIEAMVTMYHWDLPQRLQELGGWANIYMIDYFEQYAKVLFARYADRVNWWNTFNEPALFCSLGYTGAHPPRFWSPGKGEYLCAHHVLLSNARVYHMYKEQYYAQYGGKVGVALNTGHTWPRDPNDPEDVAAADRAYQFYLGWFAHALFTEAGNYPKIMIDSVNANSLKENYKKSRLPEFTEAEVEYVRGTSDFLGLNYYTSGYAGFSTDMSWAHNPSRDLDQNIHSFGNNEWPQAASTWLRSVPEGLRALLNWVKTEYNNVEVVITENGWSDRGELEDAGRIDYLTGHLQAVLDANTIDKCNVTAYTYWSVIDNFEWLMGYSERFGMFHVDFESEQKTRTPKRSVSIYRQIIETRRISKDLIVV